LNEIQLIAIIKGHRGNSLGADDGGLSNERAEALDRYHGRPYGNEDEGRSAVVSRDLSETVDWAMPAVMRVFTQSGNLGEFDPVGPEDEELAQQESDAVNHVVMKENDGFIMLHDVCKDAMLLKNGYAKHYWDETEKISEEEYKGISIQALAKLFADLKAAGAEVEVKGQESRMETVETPQGPMETEVFDIRLQIKRKTGRVMIEAIPCEELRVSKSCRGRLSESPFVEHVTRKTRTELKQMGMDATFVDSLPAFGEYRDKSGEKLARDSVDDESDAIDVAIVDKSMEQIEFCEAYIKVDWDDDGLAELRKVVTVADKIPPGDEWNEQLDAMPVTGGVIKRVPHRHVGESLHDELADLIEIKTTLSRQLLDNIYLTNNNQWLVNERVNLPDFLQSLPGGIKRIKGLEPVSGSVEAVMTTPIIGQVLPAIDYFDGVKQTRTGISESTTGLDPDILKQSTKGAFLENLNRASQKIEMITRMLAETFVKPMLLEVHSLLVKHQDKPKMMRLRGKFVEINPQEWKDRTDLTLKVGLGTGNEEEKREKLMIVAQAQQQIGQLGLVNPMKAYNLFTDLAKTLGFDMPEKYAINPDPENPEWQEAQQQQGSKKDPLVEAEQVKGQMALQAKQMEMQSRPQEMQMELQKSQADGEIKVAIARATAEIDAQTKLQIAQIQIAADKEIQMFKANLDAQVRQSVAAMKPMHEGMMGGDMPMAPQ
jgi:hypothetical protein